ncbi:MAG: transcription-repair coupling factor, partial [Bacteroidia bacterium]|nr:transcription-repair coupling factor [Bacteroidia bacterium]
MPINYFSGFVKTKSQLAELPTTKFSQISGLSGSSFSFLCATLFKEFDRNFLVLISDKEKSAYLYNELQSLCGDEVVLFFPESAKHPYHQEEVNNSNVQQRAEILNVINKSSRSHIIITSPQALAEKVIAKTFLNKVTLDIKTGERLSLDFISEFLFSYNFEKTDFVFEPGQFSIRGGIVDIFSFSNDKPFRFELFGDEVESIRSFDPITQLSLKTYNQITLIPNIQNAEMKDSIQPFTEYLSKDTLIFGDDLLRILHITELFYAKAEKEYVNLKETIQKEPEELYLDENEMKEQLARFSFIEFSGTSKTAEQIITFHQTPQPVFNKNFDLLYKDLEANKKKGYKNYLLTESVKQAERLQGIFSDMGLTGIQNDESFTLFEPAYLNIHEGFI